MNSSQQSTYKLRVIPSHPTEEVPILFAYFSKDQHSKLATLAKQSGEFRIYVVATALKPNRSSAAMGDRKFNKLFSSLQSLTTK